MFEIDNAPRSHRYYCRRAILVGKSFDVADSVAGLQFSDRVLGADFAERFKRALEQDA